MDCKEVIFSGHAVQRMFERGISRLEVRSVIDAGDVIEGYPEDTPYPSHLLSQVSDKRAIHVVVGHDAATSKCYVITAYIPDPARWSDDFKTRRQ